MILSRKHVLTCLMCFIFYWMFLPTRHGVNDLSKIQVYLPDKAPEQVGTLPGHFPHPQPPPTHPPNHRPTPFFMFFALRYVTKNVCTVVHLLLRKLLGHALNMYVISIKCDWSEILQSSWHCRTLFLKDNQTIMYMYYGSTWHCRFLVHSVECCIAV